MSSSSKSEARVDSGDHNNKKTVEKILSKVTADSIGPGKHPFQFRFVRADEPLDEAVLVRQTQHEISVLKVLKFLEVSGAHGVPVLSGSGDVWSHFGYADLVRHLLSRVSGPKGVQEAAVKALTRKDLLAGTVSDVLGKQGSVEPLVICKPSESVLEATRRMVTAGSHRVFVVDGTALSNVLSQSMVAALLYEKRAELDVAHRRVGSMKELCAARPIYSVNETSSLLDAFRYMSNERVSGIAVLRGTRIVGAVSCSDVDLVLRNGGAVLLKTCGEIIAQERKEHKAPDHAIIVSGDHCLADIMELFAHHHVSRLWLVDRDGSPIRTISYSDVLKNIVGEAWTDWAHFWRN